MKLTTLTTPPQPRLVTLAQLQAVLGPVCQGWAWATDAITDLWQTGTPVPTRPGEPDTRILFPRQFAKWWEEVQQRQGFPAGAREAYDSLFPHIR